MNTAEKILIDGVVKIADSDKSGHVIQVLIETDELERYIIDNNEIGLKLFNMLHKKVKVSGVVINELLNGYKILNVTSVQQAE